jgi:hypothetical protein
MVVATLASGVTVGELNMQVPEEGTIEQVKVTRLVYEPFGVTVNV